MPAPLREKRKGKGRYKNTKFGSAVNNNNFKEPVNSDLLLGICLEDAEVSVECCFIFFFLKENTPKKVSRLLAKCQLVPIPVHLMRHVVGCFDVGPTHSFLLLFFLFSHAAHKWRLQIKYNFVFTVFPIIPNDISTLILTRHCQWPFSCYFIFIINKTKKRERNFEELYPQNDASLTQEPTVRIMVSLFGNKMNPHVRFCPAILDTSLAKKVQKGHKKMAKVVNDRNLVYIIRAFWKKEYT